MRSAEDGLSALREIRQESPDILLTDLNMPGMSGFELLTEVRSLFPTISVIAMSGAFCGSDDPPGCSRGRLLSEGQQREHAFADIESAATYGTPFVRTSRKCARLSIRRNASKSVR